MDRKSLSLGSRTEVAGSRRHTERERGLWRNWSGCCGSMRDDEVVGAEDQQELGAWVYVGYRWVRH